METLGFITLKEADSILEFNLVYDFWNNTAVYEQTSGTWSTSGASVNLTGTSTLATTQLALSDIVLIDYNLALIQTILDDTNITIDTAIDITSQELEILTSQQKTDLEALWLKKKKALLTAYDYIKVYCNLPNPITDELKTAQAYLAAVLFYTSGGSAAYPGVDKNIKSYSIGDMSYTFNSSSGLSGNTPYEIFPVPVYDLLKPYLKNGAAFAKVYSSAR
jgi:hypothetical protein